MKCSGQAKILIGYSALYLEARRKATKCQEKMAEKGAKTKRSRDDDDEEEGTKKAQVLTTSEEGKEPEV